MAANDASCQTSPFHAPNRVAATSMPIMSRSYSSITNTRTKAGAGRAGHSGTVANTTPVHQEQLELRGTKGT